MGAGGFLEDFRWACALAGFCAAAPLAPIPAGSQTALTCQMVTEGERLRHVCEQRPAADAIRIDLPPVESSLALSPDLTPPRSEPEVIIALAPPDLPPDVHIAPPPVPRAATLTIPAETMRAALEGLRRSERITPREARDIMAFYESRNFQPLWIALDGESPAWTGRASSLREVLARAAEHGLDPGRYRTVARFIALSEPNLPALAAADVGLSQALVLYAREASTGQIAPSRIHPLITPDLKPPAANDVLDTLTGDATPREALLAYHPPHEAYRALQRRLVSLRAERTPAPASAIPNGPVLRIGMRDQRVPLIRAQLGLETSAEAIYDRPLAVRVASIQKTAGLTANGLFTDKTRRALTGEAPSLEEAEIIANMERWRWVPRELGADHIFVNVPELTVRFNRGAATVFESRIIVGKDETQTPFFSDEMDHIVLNPSWYVPPGILKREPKYLDPAWAAARGYEIRRRGNVTTVRVPPSASNALGNVKFMFPNHHSVYLHDTPGRHLFNASRRTLSNGCVRVENPLRLAATLFDEQGWTEERFRAVVGRGERYMRLPRKIPIHIGHFTLTVGPDGALQRHQDIYGHSARLRQLLGLS